ncbi:PP2C family protein-serine/threonine phosphatase [Streptomyces megasporus]|uniref:PP2C family protein-serine/threonine phosphatase n=1 Tax=Streptomyces megasporus TaxID=44060 RepID=UPI00068F7377|nr:PP2C family protein-serine/threonine phosphatase [Streptomyces megasporus]
MFWLVLLTVVLGGSGYFGERDTRLVPFLIFVPALVAGRGTVRQTAFAAGWVALVLFGSLFVDPLESPAAGATMVLSAVALGALSVVSAWQRTRRDEEIIRLRSAAATLQRQILRPLPVVTDQLLVDGVYEPVEEDSRVGGDLYEIAVSPYGTRVCIADVQGKGLPAIGTAFAVLGAFREAAHREPTLTAVVDAMENAVIRHNAFAAQTGEPERFVTALVLAVDGEDDIEVVNCGHLPPYLLSRGRSGPLRLRETNVPLGLGPLVSRPRTVERVDFPTDATLLLYTDGVTEARAPSGAFFSLEAHLADWVDAPPHRVAADLLDRLMRHTDGSPSDDIAVLVLRRRVSIGPERATFGETADSAR